LLRAAVNRWPKAAIMGCDIDRATVARLKTRHPRWQTGKCDFLNARSRASCAALAGSRSPDIVILNPPFSGRGNSAVLFAAFGETVRASIAAAFVVKSAELVRTGGEVLALLPAGTMDARKDASVWSLMKRLGEVEIVRAWGSLTFDGCAPNTILMKFRKKYATPRPIDPILIASNALRKSSRLISVSLHRGRVSMHNARETKGCVTIPLIHSTELSAGTADFGARRIDARLPTVSGPVVLLPRVGAPRPDKVALVPRSRQFVLSDCVIALRCSSVTDAVQLRARMIDNWERVRSMYVGTCAKYVTCERLELYLANLDVVVESANVSRLWLRTASRDEAQLKNSRCPTTRPDEIDEVLLRRTVKRV